MKNVPINQKYLLTVSESAEYFGIGIKGIRKIILDYPRINQLLLIDP